MVQGHVKNKAVFLEYLEHYINTVPSEEPCRFVDRLKPKISKSAESVSDIAAG